MQLKPQQQQQFAERLNSELGKLTMTWSNILKEWYPFAIAGLRHASVLELRIPQDKFSNLFKSDSHGINMNIVAVLANNLEGRTPAQMEVDPRKWGEILKLNNEVARLWKELANPIEQRVVREFEILSGKGPSLKMIKAEA
jgi:hypothetical protein